MEIFVGIGLRVIIRIIYFFSFLCLAIAVIFSPWFRTEFPQWLYRNRDVPWGLAVIFLLTFVRRGGKQVIIQKA